jgi:hypothetical protein
MALVADMALARDLLSQPVGATFGARNTPLVTPKNQKRKRLADKVAVTVLSA